jgi:alpha-mannosidase
LFNQFHDILPGSSIRPVYKDALEDYQRVGRKARGQLQAALKALTASVDTRTKGQPVVVFNTLSWPRDGLVKIAYAKNPGPVVVRDAAGKEVASQWVVSPKDDTLLFVAKQVPPLGYRVYTIAKGTPRPVRFAVTARGTQLKNRFFQVEIDPKTGNVSKIWDKRTNRNLLAPGEEGNRLQLFEDIPRMYDAWNIGYTGRQWEVDRADTVFVKEQGPVRAVIRVKKSFLGPSKSRRYPTKDFPSSFFTQDVTLYRDLPWVDCHMTVDWWENHILAKVAFPLSVSSKVATYEIPFAAIERPTTRNNSWDRARFEDSAQNWADLSGQDFGVSVLNHVKQGYDTPNPHTIRLTLLRSPLSPDPTADRGINRFRYALYPHGGNWKDGETVLRGWEYNVPLVAVRTASHKGELPREFSFVQVKPRTVILAALKEAEDGGGVIVRFYEWAGRDTQAQVRFFKTPSRIVEVNLIEDEKKVQSFSGRTFQFSIGHNAIRSFKVTF